MTPQQEAAIRVLFNRVSNAIRETEDIFDGDDEAGFVPTLEDAIEDLKSAQDRLADILSQDWGVTMDVTEPTANFVRCPVDKQEPANEVIRRTLQDIRLNATIEQHRLAGITLAQLDESALSYTDVEQILATLSTLATLSDMYVQRIDAAK